MHPLIKRLVRKGKLAYLWITRILLAPNRFGVGLLTRLRFAIFGGFIGDQVALYGLTRRSKTQYLSEFDWYRSRWINEPFDTMLNNKLVCNEVLQHHIRVPRILFVKNKGRLVAHGAADPIAGVSEVLAALREQGSLFLKPLAAGKGKGVRRLDAEDGAFRIDGRAASEADTVALLRAEDGWFLSETMEQHADLARIHAHTTNTIRIITMRRADGAAHVFFAVLRIGTSSTIPVDNGSRGGLVARIDLETGVLSEARTLWSRDRFTAHPDSGAPIEGAVVPEWAEVRRQVLAAADAIPYVSFVAWDILVTPEGPCVIEANTSSGVNIIQLWGPQRNDELGAFYREQGVIR